MSSILEAVQSQNPESVDHLLSTCDEYRQEDVNQGLVESCSLGDSKTAQLLLSKFKADPDSVYQSRDETDKESDKLACVLIASMRGHVDTATILLDYGANFLVKDDNGASAIHYVMASNAKEQLIDRLVETYGMSAFTQVTITMTKNQGWLKAVKIAN